MDLVCVHCWHIKKLFVTKPEPSKLSVYKFNPVYRTSLVAEGKNLLELELTVDIIALVLSSVNNDLFIFFIVIGMCCEIKYVGIT